MTHESPRPTLGTLAAQVAPRLHSTPCGTCACGACNHQIRQAAARAGVRAPALAAAVAAQRPPAPPAAPPRPRRPLTSPVGTSATVTVDGRRTTLAEGLLAIAVRAHGRS